MRAVSALLRPEAVFPAERALPMRRSSLLPLM
jgi:hypothetical protein